MLYKMVRSLLFRLDPETAHALIMGNIDWAAAVGAPGLVGAGWVDDPVEVMGLSFPNAVGLAAGMDKTGEHVTALGSLGFGHIEAGTVTPRPQPGNARPRLWRVIPAEGVINHMGFNNCGAEAALSNLKDSAAAYRKGGGVLGVNIGKQNATPLECALPDYCELMGRFYRHADYLAVDISCPNTAGLVRLQEDSMLEGLVAGLAAKRRELEDATGRRVPLTVKIGPDLADDAVRQAADVFVRHGMDAVTATNTTTSRAGVEGYPQSANPGGLSGKPLFERSTEVVRVLAEHLRGEIPVIAVGGVMSAQDAVAKMQAGASLVQLYTGFIYKGPALVRECAQAVADWRAAQAK
ncbi:MAG: quinone-dependent dihydroorotate dehydrogenase [Duodenibacillus sp.]|nr:quinone-dependent dihydroorotate dehydrogenase [Duodenibacillus sp.]